MTEKYKVALVWLEELLNAFYEYNVGHPLDGFRYTIDQCSENQKNIYQALTEFQSLENKLKIAVEALERIESLNDCWGREEVAVENIGGYNRYETEGVNASELAQSALDKIKEE